MVNIPLIRSGEKHAAVRRLAAVDALAFLLAHCAVNRDATDCRLCLLLDSFLGFRSTVPMAEKEASFLDFLLELLPSVNLGYVGVAEVQRLYVNVVLNVLQKVLDSFSEALYRNGNLLKSVAAGKFHGACSQIASSHGKTYRNSLEFPFSKLESRTQSVPVITLDCVSVSLKFLFQLSHLLENRLVALGILADNRNYNNLNRSKFRRKNKTVVISVSHNQRTHQTG